MAYSSTEFLNKIKPMVIADMKKTGILASLTGAQAIIESNWGNSGLTQKANNLFGMKGKYNGESVKMLTTEYYNGVKQRVYADFRKYPSWADSIADHSGLFNRLSRYKNLRGETDYKKACKYVKEDGYATSPTYTTTLINTIEKYKLYEWDNEALGKQNEVVRPTLRKGSKGDAVKALQVFLNLKGYPCGIADGIFGQKTHNAVVEWQKDHSLTPDGIVGKKTWATMY